MQTRNRNTFTTIHTEGALLPVDLLQRIRENDSSLEGLTPESYYLAPGEKINEAINRSWNRLNGLWSAFKTARRRLGSADAGTTLTRERWLLPLFQELGFGRLQTSRAVEIDGKSYAISHRWQNIPLHLIGCGLELDKRTPGAAGAARVSPHSLVQEFLNRSEDTQWGVVSNGLSLRILRDNATLTRQAFVDFDLEAMFEGEIYSDFVLLWLVCHQSRFETTEKEKECQLERWSKNAQARGTRALDDLRRGVEEAIVSLGQGFLQHPLNQELRARLKKGDLDTQDYYRQLLRLVYRLIFLFTAEDRDLLLLPNAPAEDRQRYLKFYSTGRLRTLAERQRGSRHHDRYEALRLVMSLLGSDKGCPELAIPVLGGFLFVPSSTADLNEARLDNQSLLKAVRSLAFITEKNTRRAVDYRNLGPEELGSVYESLLELHPLLNIEAGTFELSSAAGNERKTTGSYYTPSSLIAVLLDSALDPVIEDRLRGKPDADQQEQALLDLKVCDPACGSGHFLIAAARRIAGRLAQARAGGDEAPLNETRRALRDVIRHCIYGVDINPMAVELCKVNLWLESLEPGKPLSFLDAHIQCGDSLVGVGPGMDISEIQDDAFKPVFGDDKVTATALRRRNKRERSGQLSFRWEVTVPKKTDDAARWRAEQAERVEVMPEDEPEQVQAKAQAFAEFQETDEYIKNRLEFDLWTAAFFWPIPEGNAEQMLAPTQQELILLKNQGDVSESLINTIRQLSKQFLFFHWDLAFPQVFLGNQSGFDCVIGNPPWERIKIEERGWFSSRSLEIANAPNSAKRKALIDKLLHEEPNLFNEFKIAKKESESRSKFMNSSGRFPYGAVGDVNTFSLFSDLNRLLIKENGMAGFIVPTSLLTDYTYREYFNYLISSRKLQRAYDFTNSEGIFNAVDRNQKFCLLTLGQRNSKPLFAFGLQTVSEITDPGKCTTITTNDIRLVSPNTNNCPAFQSTLDSKIILDIYNRIPVLIRDDSEQSNWNIDMWTMFHMSNDSGLFIDEPDGNIDAKTGLIKDSYRLYEGKMIWQYDHRFSNAEVPNKKSGVRGRAVHLSSFDKQDPNLLATTRYYVKKKYVYERARGHEWFIGYREIAGAVANIRTMTATIVPLSAVGNKILLIGLNEKKEIALSCCLLANLNSFVFDYIVRQRITGISLSFYIVKQVPTLPPSIYQTVCPWKPDVLLKDWIIPRVVELCFTSWDLYLFAKACGFDRAPFVWSDERRMQLRCELDAAYFYLYNIDRANVEYILDTFDGIRRKDESEYGEYFTKRRILELFDNMNDSPKPSDLGELPPIKNDISINQAFIKDDEPAIPMEKSMLGELIGDSNEKSAKVRDVLGQSMVTDFGLYKCLSCGKMVMSYEQEGHLKEKHAGRRVEWKKIR